MKINLNTNLIGLDGMFCTYHGSGDPDNTLNTDLINNDFDEGYIDYTEGYFWDHFLNKEYMVKWDENIQDYLKSELFPEIFKVLNIKKWNYEADGYTSPREYNFDSDCNHFFISVGKRTFETAILKYVDSKREKFDLWLKERYTSCDGFRSWTSNRYDEWKKDFLEERIQEIGAALSFIISEEIGYSSISIREDSYYTIFNDLYYSEFCDTSDLEQFLKDPIKEFDNKDWQIAILERKSKNILKFEELDSKIRENYLKPVEETLTILLEGVPENEFFEEFLRNKIINIYSEIENKTLKLEL